MTVTHFLPSIRDPHTLVKHVSHYTIGGVMVNMFTSSVVDHVFIDGVMANMLPITPPQV